MRSTTARDAAGLPDVPAGPPTTVAHGGRDGASGTAPRAIAGRLRHALGFEAVIILTGLIAGMGGTLLALLLHFVQHLAYGYDLGHARPPEDFLEGVTGASPLRRVMALTTCGAVAGIGWWALYRFGKPLVGIEKAVGKDRLGPVMPFCSTLAHVFLQIVTVALGSPLGREVAPRELAAMLATRLAARAALTPEETRIVIASAAGAGLAAVYNVPVGGAVLALEVLLVTLAPKPVLAAVTASVLSTVVASVGLGHIVQYKVPPLVVDAPLIAGAAVLGPVCGLAAAGFRRLRARAIRTRPQGWRRIPLSIAVFAGIGLIATLFPQLPGNGRSTSQLGLGGDLTLILAVSLLILKVLAVAASLRVGAAGGVLTPSFTIGALLATVLAYGWNVVFPSVSPAAFAVIGAGAFLASSMAMPLTAIVLTVEFTRVSQEMWVPIIVAVAGSAATARLCAPPSAALIAPIAPSHPMADEMEKSS